MLNPKFESYAKGFDEVYEKHFGKLPTMLTLISHGWLLIKSKKSVNFYKIGKKHAVRMIKELNYDRNRKIIPRAFS